MILRDPGNSKRLPAASSADWGVGRADGEVKAKASKQLVA